MLAGSDSEVRRWAGINAFNARHTVTAGQGAQVPNQGAAVPAAVQPGTFHIQDVAYESHSESYVHYSQGFLEAITRP